MKRRRWNQWMKIGLVLGTLTVGILPGGCETIILRIATPFLI